MSTASFSRLDPSKRREQILGAASTLFAARDYDEFSIEDIANSAGVTRGLVHHYFGGRKQVYIALIERLGAQPTLASRWRRPTATRSSEAGDLSQDRARPRPGRYCSGLHGGGTKPFTVPRGGR